MSDNMNSGENPFNPHNSWESQPNSGENPAGYDPFGSNPHGASDSSIPSSNPQGSTHYGQSHGAGQFEAGQYGANPYGAGQYGDAQYGANQAQYGANQYSAFGQGSFFAQQQGNPDPGLGVGQPGGELPPQVPVISGPPTNPDLGAALSVAFKQLNRSLGAWLGAALAFFAGIALLLGLGIAVIVYTIDSATNSAPTAGQIVGVSVAAIIVFLVLIFSSFVMNIFMNRGAFETIDGRNPSFGTFFKVHNWGSLIGVSILAWLVQTVALLPGYFIVFIGMATTAAGAFDSDPTSAGVGTSILGYLLLMVGAFAVMPVTAVMPLLVMDGRATALGALGTAVRVVKPHYWMALVCFFVISLVSSLGAILLYVGLLYTMPLGMIATVYIYRQLIAGRRPVNMG